MVSVVGGTRDGTQGSVFNLVHAGLFQESCQWGNRSQEVGGKGAPHLMLHMFYFM